MHLDRTRNGFADLLQKVNAKRLHGESSPCSTEWTELAPVQEQSATNCRVYGDPRRTSFVAGIGDDFYGFELSDLHSALS